MNVEPLYESKNYRKAAQNLFNTVSELICEAGRTVDQNRRRELYLRAMRMSNEAYQLLGKARECTENTSPDNRFGTAKKTL